MEQMRIDRRVVMTKRFLKGSLIEILKKNHDYLSNEDGSLLKNKIIADAYNNEPHLIELLLEDETAKKWFFTQLSSGITIFNAEKFINFYPSFKIRFYKS